MTVCAAGLDSCLHVRNDDMYLSFLPLPHIFERIVVNSLLACGAAIGFYRGDPLKIIEDVIALKPTIFCAVPRLYNRIYDKINQKVASSTGLSGKMLRVAVTTKLKNLKQHKLLSHSVWDPLVFDKIKVSLGMHRVRIMLSGGAPLPLATMDFFRILLGSQCSCHEGYGQTETTGATSLTMTGDFTSSSHVGGPFPCCDIKLVDVAEMSYFHTDTWHDENTPCQGTLINYRLITQPLTHALTLPLIHALYHPLTHPLIHTLSHPLPHPLSHQGRGEIWVRGPSVIRGYYRDEEETLEAGLDGTFKNPGSGRCWLRSGDIGMWLPNGQLAIIDRKKNMFKLSQGEYVAVEKVEGVFTQASLVGQIFVYGA